MSGRKGPSRLVGGCEFFVDSCATPTCVCVVCVLRVCC